MIKRRSHLLTISVALMAISLAHGQDKPAPDLSPTSAQDGIPMKDVERSGPPAATPARSQDQERQTIARPAPSWER